MLLKLIKKLYGSSNDRYIKSLRSTINQINSLAEEFSQLSDENLRQKTNIFRNQLESGRTLNDILPHAFVTVREAAYRTLAMKHFDVQMMGGIVLHNGMIAEMRTGEGKTLMSTLPAYLNALTGKGVHVVTVNDYLAQRDAEWMGNIYKFLGLNVGCITQHTDPSIRKMQYQADITYGTNNEFGFDYLRDNLKYSKNEMAQRDFHYAIVDEIDSILIDEARTPLIISGKAEDNSQTYQKIYKIIKKINDQDFDLDEKARSIMLNDLGCEKIESILKEQGMISSDSSLYDIENMKILHHVNQALKAQYLYIKDKDYMIKDGQVMIIDEFTGRVMDGRRYSDGLHSAIEAKEKLKIQHENQTIASITYQNYFRMYQKLSGMTGTAMTEANEFADIYNLQVMEIPTHLPIKRQDLDDTVYRTAKEKYHAIVEEIIKAHQEKQPILVGTISIEKSEYISSLLKAKGIKHNVLNAKYHEKEAEIIAQAGMPEAVTIATNMAGRGTDIMLGGNIEILLKQRNINRLKDEEKKQEILAEVQQNKEIVKKAGGLFVIGTERHESRRIDDQLRGRSGRQGDPGKTKFFLSMEDDLMRLFGSEKLSNLLVKMGLKEGEAIIHPWVSKSLAKAQQKVEGRNYEIRKNLLQFDNVMNEQRKIVYAKRNHIMDNPNTLYDTLTDMTKEVLIRIIDKNLPKNCHAEEWNIEALKKEIHYFYNINVSDDDYNLSDRKVLFDDLLSNIINILQEKRTDFTTEKFSQLLQMILFNLLDGLWKDHLHSLDHLRSGINLRAYAQKNPLNEYKIEAFALFKNMLSSLEEQFVQVSFHLHNSSIESLEKEERVLVAPKSRNAPCPCQSGKKYKYCHGLIN